MMSDRERDLAEAFRLREAIDRNVALVGRTGIVAHHIIRHITGKGPKFLDWSLVQYWKVAEDAGVSSDQVSRVSRAMVNDCLISRMERKRLVERGEYRTDVYHRLMVGNTFLDGERAVAIWVPDWAKHDPRPDHQSSACPGCGSTSWVKICRDCGLILDQSSPDLAQ